MTSCSDAGGIALRTHHGGLPRPPRRAAVCAFILLVGFSAVGCGRGGFDGACDGAQAGLGCESADAATEVDAATGDRVASFALAGCGLVDDAQGLVGVASGTMSAETDRHGVTGAACRFAADAFITVPYSPMFASPQFSVAVWLSADWPQIPQTFAAVYMWRSFTSPGGHNLFVVRQSSSDWRFEEYFMPEPMNPTGNPWNVVVGPTAPQTAEWIHAVVTYDGAEAALYINGVEQGRLASTYSSAHSNDLIIGAGEGYNFAGDIDDLTIYNRALSPQEIVSLSQQ